MAAIEVTGMRKVYGEVAAVDGLDLTVGEGEVEMSAADLCLIDPGRQQVHREPRVAAVRERALRPGLEPRIDAGREAGPVEQGTQVEGIEASAPDRVARRSVEWSRVPGQSQRAGGGLDRAVVAQAAGRQRHGRLARPERDTAQGRGRYMHATAKVTLVVPCSPPPGAGQRGGERAGQIRAAEQRA